MGWLEMVKYFEWTAEFILDIDKIICIICLGINLRDKYRGIFGFKEGRRKGAVSSSQIEQKSTFSLFFKFLDAITKK